jgi:alpha-L-rhamnosidase
MRTIPLALLVAAALSAQTAAIRPEGLRAEYRTDPLGIDVGKPRLSWRVAAVEPGARGVRQSAYRILVASSESALVAGRGDLWDSGKVGAEESTHIIYGGKPLPSGTRAFWRVRLWDQKGAASAWSRPARWSMGLLRPEDWKGKWIGKDGGESGPAEARALAARMLRKEFRAAGRVVRATAYLSGLGVSELYLNGRRAGDHVLSPGLTEYDKRVFYVTYDVTGQILAGANAVGVILGNGRYWAPRVKSPIAMRNFGYPKLLFQLDLEFADGSRQTIASDESWKLTTEGPIRANNEFDGEEYDARREMAGWARAGFDDANWEPAGVVDAPKGALVAQMAEPMRVTETLKPAKITQPAKGVFVFDLGQNMVGWCRLRVSGPAGTTVKLRHAETLQPDGTLYTANLRSARAEDRYTLKGGGPETWEPRFVYHGFRFVEITGYPGEPKLDAIEGRVVHDDLRRIADFECSNALLNRLHRNILWGVRGNYRSIPTDCPQRDERMGWLGDRSVVSRGESYLHDVAAFYSKWVADIEDAQRPTGSIPDVAPAYWVLYNDGVTWPSTFVLASSMLYDQYGDRRVIERHYPAMKKWIDYMRGFLQDGLMPKNTYGDWCVPPESPTLIHSKDPARQTNGTLISTAYFYQMLRLMSRYARLTGNEADAPGYEALASGMKQAFLQRFFRADRNQFDNGTQTSSVLPLAFGLAPDDRRRAVFDALVTKIGKESDNHVGVGLIGAQWLMRTLSENGRADLAYTIATQKTYPGWGYMIGKGATTIWELWNGDTADPAMNSGNHVMQIGDLNVWFYEYLAGIRTDPDRPGFRRIVIRPYPAGDLSFVRASHDSMHGRIASHWRKSGGRFELDVTIPPNTSATVWVPAASPERVSESGKPAAEARGVKFLRQEAGVAVFAVESGVYRFVAE